jgi:hypothetical protein
MQKGATWLTIKKIKPNTMVAKIPNPHCNQFSLFDGGRVLGFCLTERCVVSTITKEDTKYTPTGKKVIL